VGQDEPVAVGPDRVVRIEPKHLLPQAVCDRCESHRRTGMAGVRRLNGVHRKSADCVDAQTVDIGRSGHASSSWVLPLERAIASYTGATGGPQQESPAEPVGGQNIPRKQRPMYSNFALWATRIAFPARLSRSCQLCQPTLLVRREL